MKVDRPGSRAARRLAELLRLPDVADAMREAEPPSSAQVVLPIELDTPAGPTSWFTAIGALGTPRDVMLDELSIEVLFPADAETERAAHFLAVQDPAR